MIDEVKKVWLLTELARTDNAVEILNKYRRAFTDPLDDHTLSQFALDNADVIKGLRSKTKEDVHNHEWSSPYTRIDYLKDLASRAKDGRPIYSKEGTVIDYQEDFAAQIKAIEACGHIIQTLHTNEMNLLELLVKSDTVRQLLNPIRMANIEDHTDVKQIESDNDQFFNNE